MIVNCRWGMSCDIEFGTGGAVYGVHLYKAEIYVGSISDPWHGFRGWTGHLYANADASSGSDGSSIDDTEGLNALGFALLYQNLTHHMNGSYTPGVHAIGIPQWFVAIAAILVARFKRTRAPRVGFCPKCGYDLRASKERCPECGTLIPLDKTRDRPPEKNLKPPQTDPPVA
jgi:hypothetical protein